MRKFMTNYISFIMREGTEHGTLHFTFYITPTAYNRFCLLGQLVPDIGKE